MPPRIAARAGPLQGVRLRQGALPVIGQDVPSSERANSRRTYSTSEAPPVCADMDSRTTPKVIITVWRQRLYATERRPSASLLASFSGGPRTKERVTGMADRVDLKIGRHGANGLVVRNDHPFRAKQHRSDHLRFDEGASDE